jgi:hypothetical protein
MKLNPKPDKSEVNIEYLRIGAKHKATRRGPLEEFGSRKMDKPLKIGNKLTIKSAL